MQQERYKEKSHHGSALYPFVCYVQDSVEPMMVKNYHWHEEVEWIYVVKGNITIEIDMVTYQVKPDSFICISKESLHKIKTEGECLYYAFVFQFAFLQSLLYDYCENNYMIPIEKGQLVFRRYRNFTEEPYQELKEALEELVRIQLQKTEGWQLLTKAALLKIVSLLVINKCFEEVNDNNITNQTEKVETMKNLLSYIREHYQEKIYIKDMAKLVNMNETYFCRYFKKTIGKTPVTYINNLRIEEAAKLIRETDYSITEICYRVGFENVSYFIRQFKEKKQITPKKYQNIMK